MNYQYTEKLKEISIARNQSSSAAKTRGVKYTTGQVKQMKMIAVLEEAPTIESILKAYPKVGNHKANKMLEYIKRIRKEFAVLCNLKDVAGVHDSKSVGHIYLITNERFVGWIKCGKTANLVKRLSAYNCYDPQQRYRVLIETIVYDKNKAESLLIYNLKNASSAHNGEWFRIAEEQAINIFKQI